MICLLSGKRRLASIRFSSLIGYWLLDDNKKESIHVRTSVQCCSTGGDKR